MTAIIAQGCTSSASKTFIVAALPWIYSRRGRISHTLPDKDDARLAGRPPCHNRSRVVIIRWPRISNLDEFAQLGQIADIQRAEYPNQLKPAKIIVLPWSMHVLSDLAWFHSQDLEEPLSRIARTGTPVIGICGGLHVRGGSIIDPHRVDRSARGLGLSPLTTVFQLDKLVGNTRARFFHVPGLWQALSEGEFDGYDIRHDRTEPTTTDPNRMTKVLSNHDGFVADNVLRVATHGCLRVRCFGRPVQCRSHETLRLGYPPCRRHHGATPRYGFNRSIGVYLTTGPRLGPWFWSTRVMAKARPQP